MKQVAGQLRLDLAQYRSLAAFAQFAADLDQSTKNQIERGRRMVELLKQTLFKPMSVEEQVVLINAGTSGMLDDVAVEKIGDFEKKYLEYMNDSQQKIMHEIKKEGKLSTELLEKMKKSVETFKKSFK